MGTSGDDSLVGTAGSDSLSGLGGADTLDGGGVSDSSWSGDTLLGGDGDDLLIQRGLVGSSQVVDGGAGVDTLLIQNTKYPGDLVYLNHEALNSIEKLQFDSTANRDFLVPIDYNQIGSGLAANATLIGGQGSDTLNVVINQAGTYTVPAFSFQNWGPDDGILFQGTDYFTGYVLQATSSHAGVVSLRGGGASDTLVGGPGQEYLDGVFGSNSLDGGGGDDTLVSSQGSDTLRGGDGDDLLIQYGPTSPYEVLDGGPGIDTLRASSDVPTGGAYGEPKHYENLGSGLSSIERLEFASHSDETLQITLSYGQAQALAPALTVVGGQGADLLIVSVGAAPGAYALPTFQLENWQSQDTLELQGGAGASTLSGGAGDVYLQGGVGDESLSAAGAHDTLFGGDGNDSIAGGSGFNRVNGNKGDDVIIGHSAGGDWLLGGQGQDSIDASASAGANVINGNIGADTLIGGSGNDTLRGGQGDDVIHVGPGNDWISGDLGTNTIYGGQGHDTIHAGAGHDVVVGWHAGDHVLVESGVTFNFTQVGADLHIAFSNGGEVDLLSTQQSSLPSDWILSS